MLRCGEEIVPVEMTRKKIKNMTLRVGKRGRVTLSVPFFYDRARIDAFLDQKKEWIVFHRQKKKERASYLDLPFLLPSGEAYYLGRKRKVRIELAFQNAVDFGEEEIVIKCKGSLSRAEAVYQKCLEEQAYKLFQSYLDKWRPFFLKYGAKDVTLEVRLFKARWGDCMRSTKRIRMNLRLMQSPPECIEQVAVHELVHLRYAGHGVKFHACLDSLLPNAKALKKKLDAGVIV